MPRKNAPIRRKKRSVRRKFSVQSQLQAKLGPEGFAKLQAELQKAAG